MSDPADLLPATLVEALSPGAPQIRSGALHPARHPLEHRGRIESERAKSENDRRARFHRLAGAIAAARRAAPREG